MLAVFQELLRRSGSRFDLGYHGKGVHLINFFHNTSLARIVLTGATGDVRDVY